MFVVLPKLLQQGGAKINNVMCMLTRQLQTKFGILPTHNVFYGWPLRERHTRPQTWQEQLAEILGEPP